MKTSLLVTCFSLFTSPVFAAGTAAVEACKKTMAQETGIDAEKGSYFCHLTNAREDVLACAVDLSKNAGFSGAKSADLCVDISGPNTVRYQTCIVDMVGSSGLKADAAIDFCRNTRAAYNAQSCVFNMIQNVGVTVKRAVSFCAEVLYDEQIQACAVNMKQNTELTANASVDFCLQSKWNVDMQSCVINMSDRAGVKVKEAARICLAL